MGSKRGKSRRHQERLLAAAKTNANLKPHEHIQEPSKAVGLDHSAPKCASPAASALPDESQKPRPSKRRSPISLKPTGDKLLWAILAAFLGVIVGVFCSPMLARVFSKTPTVLFQVGLFPSPSPQCAYFGIVLEPSVKPVKSLFFEVHLPGDEQSWAVFSGEDPGKENSGTVENSAPVFAPRDTDWYFEGPCNITNRGPSGLPPNLQVSVLSDRRNVIIRGNDVDVHSAIWVWIGLSPYTATVNRYTRSYSFDSPINGHATYLAYGQEVEAIIRTDTRGPMQVFNIHPVQAPSK